MIEDTMSIKLINGIIILLLITIILAITTSFYTNRQPITTTQVSPNCIIVEQGGFNRIICTQSQVQNVNVENRK